MRLGFLLSGLLGLTAAASAADRPAFWNWSAHPPLGWNAVDAYGASVTPAEVLTNAHYLHDKLLSQGWNLIVVDAPWTAVGSADWPKVATELHQLGLKLGVRMRGTPDEKATLPTDQAGYDAMVQKYAAGGVDLLEADVAAEPDRTAALAALRHAIDGCGRPMILSVAPGKTPFDQAAAVAAQANLWRFSDPIWDRWDDLNRAFDQLATGHESGGPGHWLDAGLIPLGHVAIRNSSAGPDRPTRLTRDEQLSLLSLWSLASSPLILSMNLPDTDEWTQGLLTNHEVLAIDQDSLGTPARRVVQKANREVWAKPLADGDLALGFFNRGDQPITVVVFWPELGLTGPCWVRDLWNKEDRAEADRGLEVDVAPHGAVLLKLHSIAAKPAPAA